jgi:hypothetical protein
VLFWQINAFKFDGFLHWGVNEWGGEDSVVPIVTCSGGGGSSTGGGGGGSGGGSGDGASDCSSGGGDTFILPEAWGPSNKALPWLQGDGRMLYCGVEGPIASSRLANVRDGMEDYAYIELLRAHDPAAAAAAVAKISDGNSAYVVERNVTLLREVRESIAAAIEKAVLSSHVPAM